ncbi:MAG: tryptophan--tRNA ligase, partial [Candidatus Jettenia caeni]|nr:tryptophan--tRNA ligase [Candidatus Jettenia caeni]
LERMTQFKDKSKQNAENINAGLFTYPILQAADILIYKSEAVPVGEDQVQHIELAREIVRKFNTRYGETFPEPKEILSEASRIMGLDGKAKMSKSLGNYISLVETPESIGKKLSTAVTDENRKRRTDAGNPDVCNLFTLHKHFSKNEQIETINAVCRTAEIGCVECKKILSNNIIETLTPIRLKYEHLVNDQDYLLNILHTGAKRCKEIVRDTMSEVKKKMGLI